MDNRLDTSLDRAMRPSQAMTPPQSTKIGRRRYRTPEERAEIRRRVAIYERQVEHLGRIVWLPPRGAGVSA